MKPHQKKQTILFLKIETENSLTEDQKESQVASLRYQKHGFNKTQSSGAKKLPYLSTNLTPSGTLSNCEPEWVWKFQNSITITRDILLMTGLPIEQFGSEGFFIDASEIELKTNLEEWSLKLINLQKAKTGALYKIGIGNNKLLAFQAATFCNISKPVHHFAPEDLINFFNLPVTALPGLSSASLQLLAAKGLKKVGVIRAMPKSTLQALLGPEGTHIWNLASGDDSRPLIPFKDTNSQLIMVRPDKNVNQKESLRELAKLLGSHLVDNRKLAGSFYFFIRTSQHSLFFQSYSLAFTNKPEIFLQKISQMEKLLVQNIDDLAQIGILILESVKAPLKQLSLFSCIPETGGAQTLHKSVINHSFSLVKKHGAGLFNTLY